MMADMRDKISVANMPNKFKIGNTHEYIMRMRSKHFEESNRKKELKAFIAGIAFGTFISFILVLILGLFGI